MATKNQSLVLDISARIDGLQSSMKAARSVLVGFKGDVGQMEAEVKRAFSDLGGDGAAASARQIEQSYNKMFRSIASNAKAVAAANDQGTALKLLDVGAAEEQISALSREAAMLRTVGQAAVSVAQASGQAAAGTRELAAQSFAAAEKAEAEARALQSIVTSFRAVSAAIGTETAVVAASTQMSGQKRAALQQLGFQVNDVAAQFAGGTPIIQIFGQQIGQVTQAIGLMSEGGAGLAGFLGGPWGVALTAAIVVLAPFVGKLIEGKTAAEEDAEALDKVRLASENLSTVQSALGNIFDLTTGAIKSQSGALRELALAQLLVAKAKAETNLAEADRTLDKLQAPERKFGGGLGGGISSTLVKGPEATVIENLRAGVYNAETALGLLEHLKNGGRTSTDKYLQAVTSISGRNIEKLNVERAQEGIDSLATGKLDPSLRNPAPKKSSSSARSKKGPTFASDEQQDAALEQFDIQYLQAKRAVATSAEERYQIETEILDSERQQKVDTINANKRLTAAQKKAQIAAVERIYGPAPDGDTVVSHDPLHARLTQQLQAEQQRLANDMLQRQADALDAQAAIAPTLRERRELEEQALALQQQIQTNLLEQQIATGDVADAEQARALLAQRQGISREQLFRSGAGPLASMRDQLTKNVGDMDTALEGVAANGLQDLEDGLVGLLSGTESVAGAFKKMSASIIADLARIAVQKAVLSFLGFSAGGTLSGTGPEARATGGLLGYATGGLPGFAGGVRLGNGMISGPGTGTSDSILALVNGKKPILVSNEEGIVNAQAVRRYWPIIDAMNKGTFTGFASGGLISPSLPSLGSLSPGRNPNERLQVDVRASVAPNANFDMRMEEVAVRTVSSAADPIMAGAEARTRRGLSRARLPGGMG